MRGSTWVCVGLLAVILGGLSTALVRDVVERNDRARAAGAEGAPTLAGADQRRRIEWGAPSGWPAEPPPTVLETKPDARAAAPPPESAAVQAARRAVSMAVAGHPGTALTSLECAPEPCGAVVVAADARELRAAVLDVMAAYNGYVEVDLRERADPALGHVFEAIVALGTPTAETVAALDSEF